MIHEKVKHYLYAIAMFVVFSSLCLWSWNTLAELYGAPHAQYKHIVAAMILGLMIRWIVQGGLYFQKGKNLVGHRSN